VTTGACHSRPFDEAVGSAKATPNCCGIWVRGFQRFRDQLPAEQGLEEIPIHLRDFTGKQGVEAPRTAS
jgi:hypothetical protein